MLRALFRVPIAAALAAPVLASALVPEANVLVAGEAQLGSFGAEAAPLAIPEGAAIAPVWFEQESPAELARLSSAGFTHYYVEFSDGARSLIRDLPGAHP